MIQEFNEIFTASHTNTLVSALLNFESVIQKNLLGEVFDNLIGIVGVNARELFITPDPINDIAINYLKSDQKVDFHDGTAGYGQTAIKFSQNTPEARLSLQEINPLAATVLRLRIYLNDIDGEVIIGDLIKNPGFIKDNKLIQYDRVFMAPPFAMRFRKDVYEKINEDPYGRFIYGTPPRSQGDSVFLSYGLSATKEDGKAAFLLPQGVLFRGGPEKEIRQRLIDLDLIEAVVALPSLLQPYTAVKPILLLCNKNKSEARKGKILMINAEDLADINKRETILKKDDINFINNIIINGKEVEELSVFVSKEEIRLAQLTPNSYVYKAQTQVNEFGKVTIEIRALEKIPTTQLSELVEIYRGYNASPKDEAEDGEYAVVKISDVQEGKVDVDKLTRYSIKNNAKIDTNRIQQGDILLSVRGVNRKTALFISNRENVLLSQNFAGIRCGKLLDPEYLILYFESPVAQFYFDKHTVGSTIVTLSVKDLNKLPVPLISIEEQRNIVEAYKAEQLTIKEELARLEERQKQLKLQAYESMGIDKAFTIL